MRAPGRTVTPFNSLAVSPIIFDGSRISSSLQLFQTDNSALLDLLSPAVNKLSQANEKGVLLILLYLSYVCSLVFTLYKVTHLLLFLLKCTVIKHSNAIIVACVMQAVLRFYQE